MMTLSPERLEQLAQALRNGSDIETACHYAGLSASHIYKWLELGKLEAENVLNGGKADKAMADYLNLWETLKKARADAIVRNVTYVQKAAQGGSWQAAAWWLERTVPETYAKRTPNSPVIDKPKTPPAIEAEG